MAESKRSSRPLTGARAVTSNHTSQHALARKLEAIFDITVHERIAINSLPFHVRDYAPNTDIARERDRPSQCCVVLRGVACRYKLIDNGRRQILSVHYEGDIPDLQSLHLEVMDHNFGTLTAARLGFLPHTTIRAFLRDHPRLGEALWRDTMVEGSIFREWMVGLGTRSAFARMAHFLCETVVRQRAAAIVDANGKNVPMPFTQSDMAQALGLSLVHVNRTIRALRTRGLATVTRSSIVVGDWDGLRTAGDFDPAYLHLRIHEAVD